MPQPVSVKTMKFVDNHTESAKKQLDARATHILVLADQAADRRTEELEVKVRNLILRILNFGLQFSI